MVAAPAGPADNTRTGAEPRGVTMAADDKSTELPLYCPLLINGEEGKASDGRRFSRENPADVREVATIAEQGTQADARAAIDAGRVAFDSNVGNWIYNYKQR